MGDETSHRNAEPIRHFDGRRVFPLADDEQLRT
jgi:hypothetical protein